MTEDSGRRLSIVVYSDDLTVRAHIAAALGTSIAPDLAPHTLVEFATGPALRLYVDNKARSGDHGIDLFILDGEAAPEGGMGVARQLKDELFNCPPVLVITARKEDAWLATWSRAEANVLHPIDPFTLAHTVADLLRASITRVKA
jgi:DNA-binding response OmpR family regulator